MLLIEPAVAQTEWKDRYVTLAPRDQRAPVTARPSNTTGTIIIWEDERDPARVALYAQRVDHEHGLAEWMPVDGTPVTPSFDGFSQTNVQAAYDSLGGVIITWEQRSSDGASPIIMAQRLMVSTGERDPNWPDMGLVICSGHAAERPRIVGTPDGAYITWIDSRKSLTYDRDVYLQYVKHDAQIAPGNWVPNGIEVSSFSWPDQVNPEIALDRVWLPDAQNVPQQGVVIAYQDNRNLSTSLQLPVWNIYATRFHHNGTRAFADVRVGYDPQRVEEQVNPQLVVTGADSTKKYSHAVIVWEDARALLTTGWDVYAQRLDESGAVTWPGHEDGIVVCAEEDDQTRPIMALWEQPERTILQQQYEAWVVVAWEDARTSYTSIFAALLSLGNASVELHVSNPNTTSGELVALVDDYDLDQAAIDFVPPVHDSYRDVNIAWRRPRGYQESDIHYQCIRIPSWVNQKQELGWPVTEAKGMQSLPQVSGNIFVYEDGRRRPIGVTGIYEDPLEDYNIYCQMPGECVGPTDMSWRDMYAKWASTSDAENVRVAVDPTDQSLFVVWDEEREETGKRLVYLQKFDKDGVPRWQNGGVLVSTGHATPGGGACDIAHYPDVCEDRRGGAFVAWEQQQTAGTPQVWFTRVNADGTVDANFYRTKINTELSKPRLAYAPESIRYPNYGYAPGFNLAALRREGTDQKVYVMRPDPEYPNPDGVLYYPQWTGSYEDIIIKSYGQANRFYLTAHTVGSPGTLKVVAGNIEYDGNMFLESHEKDVDYWEYGGSDLYVDPFDSHPVSTLPFPDGLCVYAIKPLQNDPMDVYIERCFRDAKIPALPALRLTNNIQSASTLPSITTDRIPAVQNFTWRLGGALVAWNTEYLDGGQNLRHKIETRRVRYQYEGDTSPYYSQHAHDPITVVDGLLEAVAPKIASPLSPNDTPYGLVVWEGGNELSPCANPRPKEIVGQFVRYVDPNIAPFIWTSPQMLSPGSGLYEQTSPIVLESAYGDTTMSVFWYDTRTGVQNIMGTRVYDYLRSVPAWEKSVHRDETAHESTVSQSMELSVYPAPLHLNARGIVRLTTPEATELTLDVFDVFGRAVHTVYVGHVDAGMRYWTVEPTPTLPCGLYFWRAVGTRGTPVVVPVLIVK